MFSNPWLFTVTIVSQFSPFWFPGEMETIDHLEKTATYRACRELASPLWQLFMAENNQMLPNTLTASSGPNLISRFRALK